MRRFTDAIRSDLQSQNWYSALFIALSLPDVCGSLAYANVQSSHQRYRDWFTENLASRYTAEIGPDHRRHEFLTGSDCYALRCAYLHNGLGEIGAQPAQQVLDKFQFSRPIPGTRIHMNQSGTTLQLQVDVFCADVADAVDLWFESRPPAERQHIEETILAIS